MAKAIDVARHLIHLASQQAEPEQLTHLQLQKLLYYVQGWHLASVGKPLFDDRIEAWVHGPVVKEVWPAFCDHKYQHIPTECAGQVVELPKSEREAIGSVWTYYKQFSANKLRDMTHKEPPWVKARGSLHPSVRCDREISQESMREYFRGELERYAEKGSYSLEALEHADEAIAAGLTTSLDDLVKELAD